MAIMRLEADQFIELPATTVFDRVCSEYFTYQPLWDPAIIKMEPQFGGTSQLGSRATIERAAGKAIEIGESTIVESQPGLSITVENRYPKHRETRRISCHPLRGGGSRIHVVIDSEIGIFARFLAPLTLRILEQGLAMSLHEAKSAIELGQPTGYQPQELNQQEQTD